MAGEGAKLATGWLELTVSTKGAQKSMTDALIPGATATGNRAGGLLGGGLLSGAKGAIAPIAGLVAAAFATGVIVDWGQAQVKSLARIETINTQTATAIKSTGGAAGVTAEHVEDLAGRLENLTATEAESIQKGANLLLTFKNIRNEAGEGNDIFDQTTVAMVDMARAMGTDAEGGAIQLGKALNDPIKGIAALARVGITFTEDQKDLIATLVESGEVMEAQKIILAELNSQFGGSAQAYAQTYAGKVDLLGHAWGTFGETIFQQVMPALGALADFGTDSINWLTESPQMAEFTTGIQGRVDLLLYALQQIRDSADGFTFENVRTQMENAFPGLEGVFDVLAELAPQMPALQDALVEVGKALVPVLPALTKIAVDVLPLLPVLLPVIVAGLQLLSDLLVGIGPKFENGASQWEASFARWGNGLNQIINFFNGVGAAFSNGGQQLNDFFTGLGASFENGWQQIAGFGQKVGEFFTSLPAQIIAALGSLGGLLIQSGRDLIAGFIAGIGSMAGDVASAVGGVMGNVLDFFPHSPAKTGPLSGSGWTDILTSGGALGDQYAEGILRSQGKVQSAMTQLTSGVPVPSRFVAGDSRQYATAPGSAGAAAGRSFTQNIYGAPNQPPETIARIAADSANFEERLAG